MLEKYLQDLGLSDKEAAVYVTLLGVDNASVLDLAQKTKINRTTIYLVLDSLMKKGLASEVQENKKTHYQAEPPERLETYVERQKIVLEEQAKRVKDLIPQLKSVQRESGERPVVKYFEGREGIISVNDEFFKNTKEEKEKITYLIYPRDLLEELFSNEERQRYRKIRLEQGIKSLSIYTFTKGEYSPDNTGNRLRIDKDKYPLKCDISVLGDRVKISILDGKLSGIFIKSQDLADTLKSLVKYIHDHK